MVWKYIIAATQTLTESALRTGYGKNMEIGFIYGEWHIAIMKIVFQERWSGYTIKKTGYGTKSYTL